ncbi:DNA-directed RNA polymerase subunit beta, partial (apicoplast) [Toxoplasma gondii GAB2-2007-GAL-DOM2]
PKQSYYIKKNLDSLGIIKEGEKILTGSILLTKIKVAKPTYTYKSIFKLIYSIFGKTIRNIKDNSLYIQTGKSGRVSKIELFLVN